MTCGYSLGCENRVQSEVMIRRFVLDTGVVLRVLGEGIETSIDHQLLPPRSSVPRCCRSCTRLFAGGRSPMKTGKTVSSVSGS